MQPEYDRLILRAGEAAMPNGTQSRSAGPTTGRIAVASSVTGAR